MEKDGSIIAQNQSPQPEVEGTVALIKRRREEDAKYREWKERMFLRQKALELANNTNEQPISVVRRAYSYYNWIASGSYSEQAGTDGEPDA